MTKYTNEMVDNLNNAYNEIYAIDPWKNSVTSDFRKILLPIAIKYNIPLAVAGQLFSYTYHIRRCSTWAYKSSWNTYDTEKEMKKYKPIVEKFFFEEVLLNRKIRIQNDLSDLCLFFKK